MCATAECSDQTRASLTQNWPQGMGFRPRAPFLWCSWWSESSPLPKDLEIVQEEPLVKQQRERDKRNQPFQRRRSGHTLEHPFGQEVYLDILTFRYTSDRKYQEQVWINDDLTSIKPKVAGLKAQSNSLGMRRAYRIVSKMSQLMCSWNVPDQKDLWCWDLHSFTPVTNLAFCWRHAPSVVGGNFIRKSASIGLIRRGVALLSVYGYIGMDYWYLSRISARIDVMNVNVGGSTSSGWNYR